MGDRLNIKVNTCSIVHEWERKEKACLNPWQRQKEQSRWNVPLSPLSARSPKRGNVSRWKDVRYKLMELVVCNISWFYSLTTSNDSVTRNNVFTENISSILFKITKLSSKIHFLFDAIHSSASDLAGLQNTSGSHFCLITNRSEGYFTVKVSGF